MNDIKGFTFYQSYYEALEDLNVDDKKEILNAMFEFVFEDKEPSFIGTNKAIWALIKPNLMTSKNKSKSKKNQDEAKTVTNQKQNKNELKPNENQNEIKSTSNENQNQIKAETKNNSDLLDKDKEKDKDKEEDKEGNISRYYEKNIEKLCPATTATLFELNKENSKELIKKAIDIAVLRGKKNLDYIQGILKSWKEKGYKTLSEVEKEQENPKQKNKQSHSFQNDVNTVETEALYDN